DVCGSEKKETNHWYVAVNQSGELRVIGWHGKKIRRPNAKHLCGQICVHRLLDEFMAGLGAPESPEPKADGLTEPEAGGLPVVEKTAARPSSEPARISYVMEAPFRES